MPADYKYQHISTGRLKALKVASSHFRELYTDLKKSKVIAPDIIERLRVISALLARATGGGIDGDDIELLEKLLGKDLGTEKV